MVERPVVPLRCPELFSPALFVLCPPHPKVRSRRWSFNSRPSAGLYSEESLLYLAVVPYPTLSILRVFSFYHPFVFIDGCPGIITPVSCSFFFPPPLLFAVISRPRSILRSIYPFALHSLLNPAFLPRRLALPWSAHQTRQGTFSIKK